MRSKLGRIIIENHDWKHNQMVDTKELIGYKDGIGLETFCRLFQLNTADKSHIKNQKGKVRIKIYDKEELEKIEEEIQNRYHNSHIDIMYFKRLEKQYRLNQSYLKKMYLLSSNEYKKLERDPFALVENRIIKGLSRKEKEIQERYQKRIHLTYEDFIKLKSEDKLNKYQIARVFHITIEQVKNLERGQINRVKINLLSCEKEDEIKKEFLQELLEKRKCNKEILEGVIEKAGYDGDIIKNILGISSVTRYQLAHNLVKMISVCDIHKQSKVYHFIVDLENYAKPDKEDYSKKELERKLKEYDLTLQEFLENSDKKRRIRNMYQEAIEKQGKITWKKDIHLDVKFFNKNLEEIQEKVTLMVKHFCSVHNCFKEEEDYMQESFLYIIEKGGFIQKNTKYDAKKAINQLVSSAKRYLLEKHYKLPVVYRLSGYHVERKEDTNICLVDNSYQPEEWLMQVPDEIHSNIFEDILRNLEKIEDNQGEYERVLAQQSRLSDEQFQIVMRQLGGILLNNNFAKMDKYGRIILARPWFEEE